MVAAEAADADVGAEAVDAPVVGAAGMGLAEADDVVHAQVHNLRGRVAWRQLRLEALGFQAQVSRARLIRSRSVWATCRAAAGKSSFAEA